MKPGAVRHRGGVLLMIVGFVIFSGVRAPGLPPQLAAQPVQAASPHHRITWDVAIDCSTWRFNHGISFADFGRGDSFLADGRIFPARMIGPGQQNNDPGDPGSIGKWTQRGTMNATAADINAGTRPAFYATWFHFLEDGSSLVVDGPHPESGPMAIVGGTGRFSGASGELTDAIIGSNSTGCPNLRLTIRLNREARN